MEPKVTIKHKKDYRVEVGDHFPINETTSIVIESIEHVEVKTGYTKTRATYKLLIEIWLGLD